TLPCPPPPPLRIATHLKTHVKAGARVIAVPVRGEPDAEALSSVPGGESILATAGADVASAYALFGKPAADSRDGVPTHAEYLIDRQGQLRVRWTGIPESVNDRSVQSLAQID